MTALDYFVAKGAVMDKKDSEMDVKVGHVEIKMQNTPKWAFIFISIGVAVFLVLVGLSMLKSNERFERLMKIKENIVLGKPLSEDDMRFIDKLAPREKDELLKTKRGW